MENYYFESEFPKAEFSKLTGHPRRLLSGSRPQLLRFSQASRQAAWQTTRLPLARGGVRVSPCMGMAVVPVSSPPLPKDTQKQWPPYTVPKSTGFPENSQLWGVPALVLRLIPMPGLNLESSRTTSDLIPLWSPRSVLGQGGSLFLLGNSLQDWPVSPGATDPTAGHVGSAGFHPSSESRWSQASVAPRQLAGSTWVSIPLVPWCHGSGLLSLHRDTENPSLQNRPGSTVGSLCRVAFVKIHSLPVKWVHPIRPLVAEATGRIFASMLLLWLYGADSSSGFQLTD